MAIPQQLQLHAPLSGVLMPLELVPLQDPTALRPGDTLVVRLLQHGQPLPETGVGAVATQNITLPALGPQASVEMTARPPPRSWQHPAQSRSTPQATSTSRTPKTPASGVSMR